MKKFLSALAALALLFACTPEEATTGTDNTGDTAGGNTGSTVVELTTIALSEHDITLVVGANKTLEVTFTPEDATNKDVTWESSDSSIATVANGTIVALAHGTTEVVAKSGNLTDKCTVTVKNPVSDGAVDLGLSVYWATCNVGASAPEEYGDYYAWGETETKEDYSWSTYKWCNGSYDTLTKYNTDSSYGTVDNKTVLEPEDDVAHVKLGGSWRMPTDAEWTELRIQCTWTWTTQNGVNGYIVTATNGNSIFLPAAGDRDRTSLYSEGSCGSYWCSSLSTIGPLSVLHVNFNNFEVHFYSRYRYYGFSVRPVSE